MNNVLETAISTFVAGLKTAQLVTVYNLASEKKITKFTDRKTAETRVTALLGKDYNAFFKAHYNAAGKAGIELPDLIRDNGKVVSAMGGAALHAVAAQPVVSAKEYAKGKKTAKADKPATEVITDAASDKAVAAVNAETTEGKKKGKRGRKPAPKPEGDAQPRKQNTPPHLNLRCPVCEYYAKSTPAMLAKARLICPVDTKHGKLLTAEERGEKRGR